MDIIYLQKLAIAYQDLFITRFVHRPVVDSTNNLAIELAKEGDAEGLVVVADSQTAGKGRRGKEWFSPEGNLYMSIVITPTSDTFKDLAQNNLIQIITFMSAISVVEALQDLLEAKVTIKWPNDIIIEGKKIGGILTEARYEGNLLKFVVIGIGINLIQSDLPPSLQRNTAFVSQFTNKVISRDDLVFLILKTFDAWYLRFNRQMFDEIIASWKQYNCTLGRLVRVNYDERVIVGLAKDVTPTGNLIIQDDRGKETTITLGSLEFLQE